MEDSQVDITIGIPIHNEEKHLRETLDSVLNQNGVTFKAYILENSSTDNTPQIAQEYVNKYPDVFSLHPTETLITGGENSRRFITMPIPTKYMCFLSGHDVWEPNFLQACIAAMQKDERIALCHPRGLWVDEQGRELGIIPGFYDTRGLDQADSIKVLMHGTPYAYQGCGVYRRDAFIQVHPHVPVKGILGPDMVFFCNLLKHGSITGTEEPNSRIRMRKMADFGSWDAYFTKWGIDRDPNQPLKAYWATLRAFHEAMSGGTGEILIDSANFLERFRWSVTSFLPHLSPQSLNSNDPDLELLAVLNSAKNFYNVFTRILNRNTREDRR